MNRLQHETSPYLLQHAENPVDWYPWGPEALDRARAEDRPIFLSIGYSTCHWCHVMARESFSDPEIAAVLNRHFVSVKVDQEERPDLDAVYMEACQTMTGGGGWPATLFLTPEGVPFFAGTYFPPRRRGPMIGFLELASALAEAWNNDRTALLTQAGQLLAHLRREDTAVGDPEGLPERGLAQLRQLYDREHGGFGRAPKFPTAHNLLFLLAMYRRQGQRDCLEMAAHTLRQLCRGGIFDQIGGGFCRYSTDDRFLVPHFEKMLYDNALLIQALCAAGALTGDPALLGCAKGTGEYLLREMTGPEGQFFSAQDADSDGIEGAYYLLTPEEVVSVLGAEDGAAFNRRYDITVQGHWRGKCIPNLLKSGGPPAAKGQLAALADYRRQRHTLRRDDKVLTGWNGLAITALCALYRTDGDPRWLEAALRAARFVRQTLTAEGLLRSSFRAGKHGPEGYLEDYAACIQAGLALFDATLSPEHLAWAEALADRVEQGFSDPEGGYFQYSGSSEPLILRPKPVYDGAMPSGNSLLARCLARLTLVTGVQKWQERTDRQLAFLAGQAARYPAGHTVFLTALTEHRAPPPLLTVVGTPPPGLAARIPAHWVLRTMAPAAGFPPVCGPVTYYLCDSRGCLPPVSDWKKLL